MRQELRHIEKEKWLPITYWELKHQTNHYFLSSFAYFIDFCFRQSFDPRQALEIWGKLQLKRVKTETIKKFKGQLPFHLLCMHHQAIAGVDPCILKLLHVSSIDSMRSHCRTQKLRQNWIKQYLHKISSMNHSYSL